MSGILAGCGVALLWGLASSIAGMASQRLGVIRNTFFAQAAGMLLVLFYWVISQSSPLDMQQLRHVLLVGLVLGGCSATAYGAFYKALQIGPLSLVVPVSSANGAVTLLLGVYFHEIFSLDQAILLILILCGILLASSNSFSERSRSGIKRKDVGMLLALVAMLGFGIENYFLGAESARFGTGPLLLLAISGTVTMTFASASAFFATPAPAQRSSLSWLAGVVISIVVGVCDMGGFLLFSASARLMATGLLGVLSSMYALPPLLCGVVFFHERLSFYQWLGVWWVLIGVLLLSSPLPLLLKLALGVIVVILSFVAWLLVVKNSSSISDAISNQERAMGEQRYPGYRAHSGDSVSTYGSAGKFQPFAHRKKDRASLVRPYYPRI